MNINLDVVHGQFFAGNVLYSLMRQRLGLVNNYIKKANIISILTLLTYMFDTLLVIAIYTYMVHYSLPIFPVIFSIYINSNLNLLLYLLTFQ